MTTDKVRTIYAKELRETLRDRRTVFAALVFPVILYPLMMVGFAQASAVVSRDIRGRTVRVAVGTSGASGAAAGAQLLADGFLAKLRAAAHVEAVARDDVAEALGAKEVDAGVVFEPGEGDAPERVDLRFNGADEMSVEARSRLADIIRTYRDDVVKERLAARGVPPSVVTPFELVSSDSATSAARGGFFLGRIAAMLLVTMSLFGAFYPALDLAAGEKERGTIETLLVSPASRGEIVAGKYLAILTISVVTAFANLGSLTLSFSRMALAMNAESSRGLDLSFSFTALQGLVILLALVPFAALTSALAFAISTLAHSYKEGQNYLTPLVVGVLLPAMLSVLPGIRLTAATAFIPVLNVTLLVREALLGPVAPALALATVGVTVLFTIAALVFVRNLFESEDVLLRDSGDVDWRFWRRAPGAAARLRPWHGVVTYFAVLVLIYYAGSAAQERDLRAGLAFTEIVLVLGPALLAARLAGVGAVEGLGLRPPRARAVAAALLAGAGAALFGIPATNWMNGVMPPPPEFVEAMRRVGTELTPTSGAGLVGVLALVAILPAVCEEALHRGILMRSMLTRFGPAASVVTSGILFGVFHLTPYKLAWTAALGILLGWIAYRAGSTLASMVAHATVNGLAILLPASEAVRSAIGMTESGDSVRTAVWVAPLGLALVGAGVALLLGPRGAEPGAVPPAAP